MITLFPFKDVIEILIEVGFKGDKISGRVGIFLDNI